MRRILVHTENDSYPFTSCGSLADGLGQLRRSLPELKERAPFILTSPDIWALWGKRFLESLPTAQQEATVLFLPPGERSKRLQQVERLAEEMASAGADRGSLLLTFGGGVIGDLGGFLAAIYMRGIHYVQIPTTLLAQVDSSVGGKTGVNLRSGKNLVGSFHQPRAVVGSTEVLGTLPRRQLRAGLQESIKGGLVRNPSLFRLIEAHANEIDDGDDIMLEKVISASVRLKAEIVAEDEREAGLRMILNFGHTIGHAIEAVAGYGQLLHGEAVAWGMLASLQISRKRKWIQEKERMRAEDLIRRFGPQKPPAVRWEKLLEAAARDKKNHGGKRRLILLRGLGNAVITEDVTDDEIRGALNAVGMG